MIEILIASQNQHKIKELKNILSHSEIKLITLKDLNDFEDVVEDGESFFENALIKAKYFANKHNKMTISDDSGLVVEELIFRKAIFGLIKSNGMALFVSTFVFGIIHLVGEASIQEALVNGISYFVMGFIFGYIYIKNNRNIMIPIAVHILSNLVSVLFILLFL